MSPDLAAFSLDRIIPCGIDDAGVTSLAAETGVELSVPGLAPALLGHLEQQLAPMVADTTGS